MLVFMSNEKMDIDAYRRKRLKELVDKESDGNVAAFARLHNQDAARLRQVLNPNYRGGKGFREGVARRLEADLKLPPLYFDLGIEQVIDTKHASLHDNSMISAPKGGLTEELLTARRDNLTEDSPQTFGKHQNVEVAPIGQRKIPVISYVQAGMMTEVVDPFELGDGLETITTHLDLSDGAFGLRIKGESMLPEFREGDVIIIDPAEHPLPGDFVVAKNGDEEATFKKYRPRGTNDRGEMVFELVPLNDDFPTLNSERDHMSIIGVMVEHRKYRRR
jgi:SOS-response transcriptional repressor LexA